MNFLSRRISKKKSTAALMRKRNGQAKYRAFIETLEPRMLMSLPAALSPAGVGGGGWFGPAAINPNNSSEIWMPTDVGELFHTTNGGATWTFPPTTQISQFYRSPAQFTTLSGGSAGPMWAINAGTGFPSKSTDGGVTWVDDTSWVPLTQGDATFLYTDTTAGSGIIVSSSEAYNNTTGLFSAAVYLSTNGGTSWGTSPIYTNPGSLTSSGSPSELLVSGLFRDGSDIWISTSQGILYSSNTGSSFSMLTLPHSSSVEDPSSMAVSKVGTTIRFVVVMQDPNTFTYNTSFTGGGFLHLYTADFNTTTQTLGTWTDITSHVPVNEEPTFAAMAAGNITTVYLGGLNMALGWGIPSVLKTTTAGSTWTFTQTFQATHNANVATNQVGDGEEFDYGTAGGAFSLQIDSANVNDVIITDNFTAWMTTDGGTGGANTTVANADWKDITVAPAYLHAPNTVGVAGSTAYAGSADNTAVYNLTFLSPTNVFASMTDNTGVYSTDGGNSWYYPTYNSGAFFSNFFNVTADYTTNTLFASGGKQNDLYKDWRLPNGNRDERGGGVDYSTDGGKTWNLLTQFANPDGTTNPVAQFVLDPNVAGRAYALVANSTNGGIWVTNNLYLADGKTVNTAATWTELTAPTRTLSAFTYGWAGGQSYAAGTYTAHDPNALTVLSNGTLVATYDVMYDSTDSYVVPTSGIWVSTNGGSTWTDRTDLNLTQSSMMFYTQHLTLDPADSTQMTWYASVDYLGLDYNQGTVGVFKTTNGGVSWTQLFSPGGDDIGASNVAINPDTSSTDMYVGTESGGLYYSSTKASGSFSPVTLENYSNIESIAFDPYRTSQVWVTTHGNGMQKGDSATATPSNLTAVGNTGNQVTLNWTAVSGADSYLVQYTTGAVNWQGGVTWTQYGSPLGTGSTSVNINSLSANLYYFRIVPKTGSTIDGYSNIVAGPVLPAVTNVVASADSPHEVDISWQYAGSGLGAQFQIQRSTDSSTWTVVGTTASASILSYADTTAAANTFYYYRIIVIAAGTFSSPPSNYSSAKTLAAGGLITYDGFEYGAGASLNNQGVAGNNWAGAWVATGTSAIAAAGLTPPGSLAVNGDSVGGVQTSAERDTSAALDTYGSTIWASALIKADTTTDYDSGILTVGNVQIEYHDRTGSGNFEWTIQSANNTWWGTSWGTGDVPVTNGATYFVVVEETFNAGNDSVRVWINPTPGSTQPSDASSFDYKTGVNDGGTLSDIKLTSGYYANTQFDEVRLGTTYASVAPIALPAAPAGLSATPVSSTQINLTWTSQTLNTSGYNIYSSTNGTTFTFLGTSATASYSATSLSAGTTYYFQVTAYNSSSNESGYSNRASATTTSASGLIASDSFAYSTGGLNGDGSAGSGWAGAWSTDTSSIVVNSTSLTSTVGLATSGGSVSEGMSGGTSTRNLSSSLSSNGTTVWASVLMTPDTTTANNWGGFEVGNVEIEYNQYSSGHFEWTMQSADGSSWWGTTWNSDSVVATGGTTYFLVAEITYNSGSDSVRVWLNPTPGSTAPSNASSFDYKTGVNAGGSLSTVKFIGPYYANTGFDEVRLGTSYSYVAPLGVTAPAAPSALSATTASQTQINLAWTDNATNETGFKVYQSTNGTSFTLLQTINTPNTTSYNVTGLSPQIEYWYKVTAFNLGGESSYSNTANATTLVNGLIASDDFAYSTGGLNGDGAAGDGWAGAWSTDNSSIVVSSTGLTSTVNLATSGGSVSEGTTGGTSTRTLSSSLNSNGSTLWASALITPDTSSTYNYGAFEIGNVEIEYHKNGLGTFEWTMQSSDGSSWWGTSWNTGDVLATGGTTYLMVAEITYNSGSDSVRLWINPAAGSTQPTDASSFDYKTGVNAGGTQTTVKLTGGYYANTKFDEVRLGTTYASVAPANLPASLVGLWRLDEGTGSTANDTDTDGVSDTGTVTGSPTWVAGKIGDALSLNGTSQYVQVANSTDLNISGSGFSTAMWVKSAASTWNSTETFISKGNGYEFGGVSGSKNIEFSLYIGGAWKNLTYTNTGDISTSWHDYAATYDGSNMRIWIDGTNVATLAQTGTIGSNTSVLYIGRNGSTYLGGSIDEVRVYNAALNSTNVSALYNQTALSITGLTVDSANASSYSVQNYGLETGVSQYGDTTKNFTTIPSKYLGSTFIRTAEADSTSTTANLLTFTVNQPVIVYVLFDDAITTKPAWLTSQFTDTGDNIVSAEGTFSVYKMTVSAGTFTLGGPGGTGTQGMYSVMFQSVL